MNREEPIAEKVIYAVDKDGRGFDIGLQIGPPHRIDSPHADWACPVAMIGLHGRFPDMQGVDSWQALILAVDLVQKLLATFVEVQGGKLYDQKGGVELTVAEAFGIPYKEPAEMPTSDGDLTPEQAERVSRLTGDELAAIDTALLRNCTSQFRKIARVVGTAMTELSDTIPHVPDLFYAQRVQQLVADSKLVAQGRIDAMRFGEVKLPD
jgi:hypothetical protein